MTTRMKWVVPGSAVAVLAAALNVGSEEVPVDRGGPPTDLGERAAASVHVGNTVAAAQDLLDFEVYRARVEPIFLVDRGGHGPGASACVTCHVQSGTPLRLQPLQEDGNGGAFWTEEQSRMNFEVVSGLVAPGDPQTSRLLREPLATGEGGSQFHVGGKFWDSQEDPEWQAMADWVRAAEPGAERAAAPTPPDFEFFRTCVQRIFLDREEDRMECAACHGGGFRGFAQELPEGRDYWNEEESRENYGVIVRYVEPGRPLASRFLTHPLDPHEGGDNYHSGGRRWQSQDDPEWQMLAAWVRGEETACVVEDR